MSYAKPFKIYRIICTITGKALVSGSHEERWYGGYKNGRKMDWHERGQWSKKGAFWRTEASIKKHLMCLCQDWKRQSEWVNPNGQHEYLNVWYDPLLAKPDFSRLEHLIVEETCVNDYDTTQHKASDFMPILENAE